MFKFALTVICVLFFSIQEGSSLPQYFKKCNETEETLSACMTSSANEGWAKFIKGSKKYHHFSLNPLFVPYLHVNVEDTFIASAKNGSIYGLEGIVFKNISIDFAMKRCTVEFDQPMFKFNGSYIMEGHILGLPVEGEGFGMMTLEKGVNVYYFDFNLERRYKQNYIQITHSDMDMKMEGAKYHIDNLFNGNQKMVDATNQFLNENSKNVFKFLKDSLGSIFAQTYSEVLQNYFDTFPTEEFFKE